MVNSFIRYSPYSTLAYDKKCVKAVTSMFIKVCQGHHKHYDKKVSYYYMIFIFFQRLKRLTSSMGWCKFLKDFLVSQRAAWG